MRDEISVTLRAITFPTFPIFFSGRFSLHLLRDHTFPTAVVKADWHVGTRPAKTVTNIQIRPRINAGIVHLLQLHVRFYAVTLLCMLKVWWVWAHVFGNLAANGPLQIHLTCRCVLH